MEIDHIGVVSLVVSLVGLFVTVCTFLESKSTKRAVISHKTRKAYESYKEFLITELEMICGEITQGHNKPEYRSKLMTMMGQMEGYKEHLNKTTKASLTELNKVLGIKKKPDTDVSVIITTLQMEKVPVRAKVSDQPLADALSKLIGGLKQPAPKVFD